MEASYLHTLTQYNAYANRILLEAASRLSAEDLDNAPYLSHASGIKLMRHLLAVEAYYLAQCQEQPADVDRHTLTTIEGLIQAGKIIGDEMQAFTASLSADDAARILDVSISGYAFRFPIWQLLLQVFMHSGHHRGELAVLLTSLGSPPNIEDIIVRFAEESAQPWPWK